MLKRQSSKAQLDLSTTVSKATSKEVKPPKEKHIRNLIITVSQTPGRVAEVILLLAKRLEKQEWTIVMKTLLIVHRLLRDATSDYFIKEFRNFVNILNLRRYLDISSEAAKRQSLFIKKYAQYLEEKILIYKAVGYEFEKSPNVASTYDLSQAFENLPRIQSQLNALINTRSCREHFNNEVILLCFSLLVKDSIRLYRTLNEGVVKLLDMFFNLKLAEAQNIFAIYKLFTKETEGVIHLFQILKKFSPDTSLPELQHAPTTLLDDLENHLRSLNTGTSNTEVQSRARSKTKEFIDVQTDFFSKNDLEVVQNTEPVFDPFGLSKQNSFSDFNPPGSPKPFETSDSRLPTFTQAPKWETFDNSSFLPKQQQQQQQQPTFNPESSPKVGQDTQQPYNPFLNPTPETSNPFLNISSSNWMNLFQ